MKLIRKKILNWRKGQILVEPLTSIICDVKWEKNLTFKTVKYSFVNSLRFFGYKPIKKVGFTPKIMDDRNLEFDLR